MSPGVVIWWSLMQLIRSSTNCLSVTLDTLLNISWKWPRHISMISDGPEQPSILFDRGAFLQLCVWTSFQNPTQSLCFSLLAIASAFINSSFLLHSLRASLNLALDNFMSSYSGPCLGLLLFLQIRYQSLALRWSSATWSFHPGITQFCLHFATPIHLAPASCNAWIIWEYAQSISCWCSTLLQFSSQHVNASLFKSAACSLIFYTVRFDHPRQNSI